MKKGFTMIELIFVIVILGILASVAVPRLAGTKADAEISAAVANLRTLVSDLNTYYVAKGGFEVGADAAAAITTTWSQITNVPLKDAATKNAKDSGASLKVGGKDCIDVQFVKEDTANKRPAYIKFTKNSKATDSSVCGKVLKAKSVEAYLNSKVGDNENAMPIGSSIKLKK